MTDELNPRNQQSGDCPKILNRECYYEGDEIIHQGDAGNRAFYIDSGKVDVIINEGKTKLKVTELKAGDIFGEMALITQEPRTASVVAKETCSITMIDEDKIGNIEDEAIKALVDILVERLKETTQGQFVHYKNLSEFQERVTTLVERVYSSVQPEKRKAFLEDIQPVLKDLQEVLDRYR